MALTHTRPVEVTRPGLGYAYLMTGVALGCICVSGVLGSIFTPDLVSTSGAAVGYTHQHTPLAAYSGWVFDVIAITMVLQASMRGLRAEVASRGPWTLLGIGAAGIWLAVMFASIFTPVMITGTAPWQTWVPLGSILAVVAGLILTGFLCKFVKSSFFGTGVAGRRAATTVAGLSSESAGDDSASRVRLLAQLRDFGVITEAEFQTKKDDLLRSI